MGLRGWENRSNKNNVRYSIVTVEPFPPTIIISFGKYDTLVTDVFGIFESISKSATFPSAPYPDLTDLGEATRAAWDDLYGDIELTWFDIRSLEKSKVWKAAYATENFKEIESVLRPALNELGRTLTKRIRGSRMKEFEDEIMADMEHTLYARAVCGTSLPFAEALLEAYRNGFWPCGWLGNYPEGRIKTFAFDAEQHSHPNG